MPAVSVDGHIFPAGLVIRRRFENLNTHQMRMPYFSSRVVDAGGVVVTVEGERGGLDSWNGGVASDMDMLRVISLNIKPKVSLITKISNLICPNVCYVVGNGRKI